MDDLLVGEQNECNDLQGQEQGLGNKAKAKDLGFKVKALKIVLKDSLGPRQRTPITDSAIYTVSIP